MGERRPVETRRPTGAGRRGGLLHLTAPGAPAAASAAPGTRHLLYTSGVSRKQVSWGGSPAGGAGMPCQDQAPGTMDAARSAGGVASGTATSRGFAIPAALPARCGSGRRRRRRRATGQAASRARAPPSRRRSPDTSRATSPITRSSPSRSSTARMCLQTRSRQMWSPQSQRGMRRV